MHADSSGQVDVLSQEFVELSLEGDTPLVLLANSLKWSTKEQEHAYEIRKMYQEPVGELHNA